MFGISSTLKEVVVDQYSGWDGYFSRINYGKGINPYSPYMPGGIYLSASFNVNGIFGYANIGGTVAMDNWGIAFSGSASGGLGLQNSLPKFEPGLSFGTIDYLGKGNFNVSDALDGKSSNQSLTLGLFSFQKSQSLAYPLLNPNGSFKYDPNGYVFHGIGLDTGWGYQRYISTSFATRRFNFH